MPVYNVLIVISAVTSTGKRGSFTLQWLDFFSNGQYFTLKVRRFPAPLGQRASWLQAG
jgi:hypothetical protein